MENTGSENTGATAPRVVPCTVRLLIPRCFLCTDHDVALGANYADLDANCADFGC